MGTLIFLATGLTKMPIHDKNTHQAFTLVRSEVGISRAQLYSLQRLKGHYDPNICLIARNASATAGTKDRK